MKKNRLFFAIIAMAILATAVAIVSCKKDNENAPNTKAYTVQQAADIRQMEDPLAYMKDFKKKLTESKDNEAFNLDDAAWHLACLANLDFCNVNVEYDDFQFDTLEMQVNVTDGVILLGDLRAAYEQMCTEIQQFRKGFNHCDQNLYYVNVAIDTDGNAKVALMSSFTNASKYWYDHTWYFSDVFEALDACDTLFDYYSTYPWDSLAVIKLEYALNVFEHYENFWSNGTYVMCYFPTRNHAFGYTCIDIYGSDFLNNSRVFAKRRKSENMEYDMNFHEMCYCLDSYLNLGYDFISDNLYLNEHPVCWIIYPKREQDNLVWWTHYHELKVEYGQLITPYPPGPEPE